MAAQMNWDLLNQHLTDMEAKMNELIKLAEKDVEMSNGTQKNRVWVDDTEAQNLKEIFLTFKAEMKKTNFIKKAENEIKNMKMELREMKEEKKEVAIQNLSLRLEVDELMKRLSIKEQELSKKDDEMNKLKMQSIFPAESYQEDLFKKLPEDCIMKIISLTSPQDAGRLSLLGTTFKSAADSNTVWEAFMGSDHMMEIILQSLTLVPPPLEAKDLFVRIADTPILIDGGTKTVSMNRRTGRKSYMLGARSLHIGVIDKPVGTWNFLCALGSRFPEALELVYVSWFGIRGKISKKLLSRNTLYETYLVYKLTPESYGFQNQSMEVSWGCGEEGDCDFETIFFYHSFINNMTESDPVARSDGWMEIKIDEYFTREGKDTDGFLYVEVMELYGGIHRGGLIVEGIDIRPIVQ